LLAQVHRNDLDGLEVAVGDLEHLDIALEDVAVLVPVDGAGCTSKSMSVPAWMAFRACSTPAALAPIFSPEV